MKLEFQEYKVRKLVNVHKHVDGWLWDKYSAHPYIGCRSGCKFCYVRGGHYLRNRAPESFDTLIQVKTNAIERLKKELPRLTPDIITCGDWQQPAESKYQISRQMLEVVYNTGFPLLVIERSPLLLRDLDLLTAIHEKSYTSVIFSFSSVDSLLKRAFEPRSPGIKRRLQAIEKISTAGIMTGVALMPILPVVGDDEKHLDEAIRAFKAHGAQFVLGGSLTMEGTQARLSLEAAKSINPDSASDIESAWRKLYNWQPDAKPAYSPPRDYHTRISLRVRELCHRHNLKDRMPRYIPPGNRAINKKIAEQLFLKVYDLELAQAQDYRIYAYRKAAWSVDECPDNIMELYQQRGEAGLQELPGIGKSLAGHIAGLLRNHSGG